MRAYAHDVFTYPLPEGHRFPLAKYRLVREAVSLLDGVEIVEARAATRDELELGHETDYIDRIEAGELARVELLALGLPWSAQLVERARRSVGATIEASRSALEDGASANVGGGTHHAFPDAGRGFCVFNDVVCAVRRLRADGLAQRALVVDLDVHQGDGTHAAFAADPDTFTFSVNGLANYPFRRVPGDMELDLPDGTGDNDYLEGLARLLPRAIGRARPEICFYLAGADPYAGDRLGRLSLTAAGLAARDRLVRDEFVAAGVPVCVALAGGYSDPIEETVAINVATIEVFNERPGVGAPLGSPA